MTNETQSREPVAATTSSDPWLPYVLPLAVFMAFTALAEPRFREHYVWVYLVKVIAVIATLIACRRPWRDIRFDKGMLALGAVAGLVLCAVWVAGEKFIPYPHPAILGSRAEFNPFEEIANPAQRGLFIATRLFGLTVMVSVVEEIFWRSFLLRYLTRSEFEQVPLQAFSWTAAAIAAVLFGITHPEWLSAVIFACAMAAMLKFTKSLFACIVAHGVTNLALGIYVLTTGDWKFW